jgi:putative ABC transport system ATP-binding protein
VPAPDKIPEQIREQAPEEIPGQIVVQIEDLRKEFGNVRALDGVSFTVEAGEWIAIMGPSGSGKTTLINILGGLDSPTSGKAIVDGVDVARLDENGLTRFRAEKIGFIFQQFHLVPYLTAVENVMLAQYFHSTTDEREARAALARVGLADRFTHLPSQLSGGEQQRVAVARALINHPKLILADEPTGNLDEANEEIVIRLLRELHDEGHTILMVTHAPSIGQLADRRIDLAHGHLARITEISAEEEAGLDHLLEQVWILAEEGASPELDRFRQTGVPDAAAVIARLKNLGLLELRSNKEVALTPLGQNRARDIVRRRRLAERLLTDTFSVADAEADSHACKFEHIISPELDQRICTFLGHPQTCPHGNPIPPGRCCPTR